MPVEIVIAVDFGTTYSGVAFASSAAPDKTEVIANWPSRDRSTSEKVPTEIVYDDDSAGTYRWGFSIKPHEPRITWFKLKLDPSQKPAMTGLSATLPDTQGEPISNYVRSAATTTTDYLGALYKNTLSVLYDRYGTSFVKDTPKLCVMTVPAVWSDKAKYATMRAAKAAGFENLRMISEPEAAALYTLKAISPNHLRVGEHFVICDAGGGTVDLITYKLTAVSPTLKVEESVVGNGALCGSTYLDRRFEIFAEKKLGPTLWQKFSLRNRRSMVKYFDSFVKIDFQDRSGQDDYNVPVPGLPDDDEAEIDDGHLLVTKEEVREIFKPVVSAVIKLVDVQVKKVKTLHKCNPAAILLVGGFGSNNYLRDALEEHYGGRIKIMRPLDAWSAVVRGALNYGLTLGAAGDVDAYMVTQRNCRYSYGICAYETWIEGFHPIERKQWSVLQEKDICDDVMSWYIQKGESVSERRSIKISVMQILLSLDHLVVYQNLHACTANIPPQYMDSECFTVCTVHGDLSSVPKRHFKKRVNRKGDKYYVVNYDLEMTIDSAEITFALLIDGKNYGSVDAEFI